jgi:hypothetical protein
MGHSYPEAELYERKDNVVLPLDLCGICGQEAEEGQAKIYQSVLAGFQNAVSRYK